MFTIGMYSSLSNSDICKHIYLEKIKKLYKSAVKCDDQQQYKVIIELCIVSAPEGAIDNNTLSPGSYISGKTQVQENQSFNFIKYWVSNRRLLSEG